MDEQTTSRPLLPFIVIIVVIGIIVLGGLILFVANKGNSKPVTQAPSSQSTKDSTRLAPYDNIYLLRVDTKGATYLADFAGISLYTFDKDTNNVSNCTDTCLANWKPYSLGAVAESDLPKEISVITRADGRKQFTLQGKPLYYYFKDENVDDRNGDNLEGLWHLAKP